MKSLYQYINESIYKSFVIDKNNPYYIDGTFAEDVLHNSWGNYETAFTETHKGEVEEYINQWINLIIKQGANMNAEEFTEDCLAYIEQFVEIPKSERKCLEDAILDNFEQC